jgi:hypothetical protein
MMHVVGILIKTIMVLDRFVEVLAFGPEIASPDTLEVAVMTST